MNAPTILAAPGVNARYKPNPRKRAGEDKRIARLGRFDDWRRDALNTRNKCRLLRLALGYRLMNCPNTAAQIVFESENL